LNRALISVFVLASLAPVAAQAQTLAFPEAEGFGRFATGARTNLSSASVYHVTNLNDSGPGSFRDAVSQSNRFVVFDVGGIANIQSVVPVASNITIAGQTAPGGFTIYNDRISFTSSNNLISRHFAVRKGQPGVRTDAASIARGTNMIFDHMSITWGVDGTFDINPDTGYVIDNITIQNSIVAQGLDRLGHSTGGLMQPGDGHQTSVINSLWADNVTRNPKVKGENEFINNVVYGWETAAYIMGGDSSGTSHANVEGNYFIEGPVDGSSAFSGGNSNFHIYANDNWVDGNRNGVLDGTLNSSYPGSDVVATRYAFPTTATLTAQQAVAHVMQNAGVTIVRDAVDTRLMQEVASYGTLGGVIMRETDLFPGFGTDPIYLNPRARLVDADNDGIADNWESAHGLNPANGTDWKGLNGAGYTRLEEYLNELGADGTTVTSTGGAWTSGSTWTSGVPTLADDAVASGSLTLASGHAFARRLSLDGSLDVTGGTVDVFDTATYNGSLSISGGIVTAGRVLIASTGQMGSLAVEAGGTLQTGTVASAGGAATLSINGGTFRATGVPDVKVATTFAAAGATIDTNGYSGAVSGAISGAGGLTKRGAGSLMLSGPIAYSGPTAIEEGEVVVQGSGWGQTSAVTLGSGTTLDLSAVPSGLNLTAGKSLGGSGTVVGDVVANSGAVVRPEGTIQVIARAVGIQAESLALGSDWAVFDNAVHGTGANGSYDGSDLNGGGIVLVTNDRSGVAPVATGAAATTVSIPETKTWYLYAKTAEPTFSPIAGDPATQPGGNNSFFTSGLSNTAQATTSNYEEVQTYATPGNEATWNLVSPTLTPLDGVNVPLNAGIDYFLTAGVNPFVVYGREVGTIIDGFVLADTNLTAAQLEAALSGATAFGEERVLTIDGNYSQASGATLTVEVADGDALNKLSVSGTAMLGGDLSISVASGFVPQASDVFEILSAASLVSQFVNAAPGARIATADGAGSFLVNYDYTNDRVTLSDFAFLLPGDFNGNGVVDAADYTVWRNGLGSIYALDDYNVWKTHFGQTAGSGSGSKANAAVPEPATWIALMFGIAAMLTIRRMRIQCSVHGRWIASVAVASLLPALSALAYPTLPTIPAGTFTVPAATGNAATDTSNITSTITAAVNAGGGTVVVPAGTYLSNQFSLKSNINLHLDSGATIRNNVPTSSLITTSGTLHDVAITGSGIIDGRATDTNGNNLVSLRHITNVLVQGVTIQNSSKFHLVVEEDTNLTVDGININDNYTISQHGGYLKNTDAIDYSGSHILIQNSNINSGDDDIVAKPQNTFCSDITITNNVIGAGHGISVGGQTNAGLDGLTVSHITFTGTDNGLRLKSGSAAINSSGGGGVVKNVRFSDITMTDVQHPIIINSWYNGGDHYGPNELSGSTLHNALLFDPTNPGDPTVQVDQNNNTELYPFYDNISYSDITATGGTENVAIIYGLNSIPASPTDPLRNIDGISFDNVSLSGRYGADIYYASNLDLSGLTVTATNGNAINLFGNTFVPVVLTGDYNLDGVVDAADYTVWRNGLGTIYTQDDYDVWKAHFGQTSSGSGAKANAAVPEPSSGLLVLIGVLAMFAHRRAAARSAP
jgi:autotransporter-associated beta strand protein